MLVSENDMEFPSQPGLTRRDRSLLDRARRNGYLEITRGRRPDLVRAYGFWCWKLRIPFLSIERDSPRSRVGTVRLDLFTTPYLLTEQGRTELARLPGATITPYDGIWQNVPESGLETVARSVYRIATRHGSYELRPPARSPELAKLIAAIGEAVVLPKSA
jgi:hypothetical protein